MAKYYVISNIAVETGSDMGFLMSAKTKGTIKYKDVNQSVSYDIKERINSVDYGLALRISYNMTKEFFIGAGYNFGLSKVGKNYKINEWEFEEIGGRNGVIQISAGFKI